MKIDSKFQETILKELEGALVGPDGTIKGGPTKKQVDKVEDELQKDWVHTTRYEPVNENETTDYVKELEKVYNEISKEIKKSKKWSDSHKKELYKELHEEMWDIISPGTKSAPKKFNWKSTEVYKEVSTIGPAGKNNIVPQLWDIIKESVNEAFKKGDLVMYDGKGLHGRKSGTRGKVIKVGGGKAMMKYGKAKDQVEVVPIKALRNPLTQQHFKSSTEMKKFSNDLNESTEAYEKALIKMAKDRQLKMLSKKDKETLLKVAQMMKSANESVNESLNERKGPEGTSFFQKIYPVISSPSNFPGITEEEVLGVLSALSQGEPAKGFNSRQKNLYNQLERNNMKYFRQLEKDASISQKDIDVWQDSLGY